MAKFKLIPLVFLFFSSALSIVSCNSAGVSETETAQEDDTEIESDSADSATILPEQVSTPFDIISGNEFFDLKQIELFITNTDQVIELFCTVDLDTLAEYPKALKEQFGEHETANHMLVTVIGKDANGKKLFTVEDKGFTGEPEDFYFSIPLENYRSLKQGPQQINLAIEVEYVSFRSDKSGVKPIVCEISFEHQMPAVYETIFYFKSLKLNEEKVTTLLGNNDRSTTAPEAGIRVMWNDTEFLYAYTEDSFELNKKTSAKIYHTNLSDFVNIQILDVDKGFNISDLIEEIPLSLANLQTDTYQNYPSEYVDELWIYAKHVGQVNE